MRGKTPHSHMVEKGVMITGTALFMNAFLAAFKLFAGIAGQSAAVIADAAPMERQAQRGWFLYHIIPAVYKFAVLVFGLAAFALVIWFDYTYRAAQAKGTLKRRFGVITAVQLCILVGCAIVLLVV